MCLYNGTELTADLRMVHGICALTISVLGTSGNAMSMFLICRARLFHSAPIIMLLLNMCVANMMSTAIVQPMVVASSFYGQWLFHGILCQLFGFTMFVALAAECLILMNITICQYLAVVHRKSSTAFMRHHKFLCFFTLIALPWLITVGMFLAPLTQLYDEFGYDLRKGFCTLIHKEKGHGLRAVVTIVLFGLMTSTTFYCYSAILYIHCKSQRKFTKRLKDASPRSKLYNRNVQLIKMIMAIFANYLVTYLPFMITNAVNPCIDKIPMALYIAIIYVSWSHTAINPVIYALMNPKIRALWKQVFQCSAQFSASRSMSTLAVDDAQDKTDEMSSI